MNSRCSLPFQIRVAAAVASERGSEAEPESDERPVLTCTDAKCIQLKKPKKKQKRPSRANSRLARTSYSDY